MPLIVTWNGTVINSPTSESLWSNKGGIFTSSKNVQTYFPLPMYYRKNIPVVGSFIVTIQYVGRPDLIAKNIYGSEDYWWLVYWMSGIIDPLNSLKLNDVVLIADLNKVISIIG